MENRLRLLEGLADSPLPLRSPHASSSRDANEDPVLAEARAMLLLDEEELHRLQCEVAAMRGESRGFNRYRDVMQQTLKKLKREVVQLEDDVAAAQLRASTPRVRAAPAPPQSKLEGRVYRFLKSAELFSYAMPMPVPMPKVDIASRCLRAGRWRRNRNKRRRAPARDSKYWAGTRARRTRSRA